MKPILDVACGSKAFWFDKNNPNVEFCDNRIVPYHEYYPKRYIEIKPDTACDFTALPFPDKSFKLVVFDPPHLRWAGPKSWTRLKYGCLEENWPAMIHDGFAECMRVLDDYGASTRRQIRNYAEQRREKNVYSRCNNRIYHRCSLYRIYCS